MSGQQAQPSVALPVVAIVFAICCAPIGLILAIVSLVKYGGMRGTSARTLSIVSIGLCAAFVPLVGISAAIAIPNFVRFGCRSKQAEAKGNLKALFVAEESYRAEYGRYLLCGAEQCNGAANDIGFTPLGVRIRYTYVVDRADNEHFHATARLKPEARLELGDDDAWEIDETTAVKNTIDGCS